MPIYMDLHIIPGVNARDVAEAHRLDTLLEHDHDCKCMTYWVDESRGHVFCLIDAPAKEVVVDLHNKAHGLVPHKIIEVESSVVESFLGRINDPADVEITGNGLKIINDPSFRFIMVMKTPDPVLLQQQLGREKARELAHRQIQAARAALAHHNGAEVEHNGVGFIASFMAAGQAVSCALAIRNQLTDAAELSGFRIGIHGGEPVARTDRLFGESIQVASRLCAVIPAAQVAASSLIKEIITIDHHDFSNQGLRFFTPQEELLLEQLFSTLEINWQDASFDIDEYCQSMAMSKSQLYRKCLALTGYSPKLLLKEFRLEKARELLKKQRFPIAQVTYETGFTCPSYFTKCFKKKFGIQPMAYQELVA